MDTSYKDLLAQRQALNARIEQARKIEVRAAIEKVRAIVAEYELQEQDVFPKGRAARPPESTRKTAPRYRNPETGKTWAGRGKPPSWIVGKDRSEFEITSNG